MKRVLLIGLAVALASVGMAQGRGMRMMGRGGGGLGLATREDVAKELKLTSEQKTKLEDMQEKARDEMRAQFASMAGGGRPDEATMATMRKKMEEMQAAEKKHLAEVLSPEQMARLKELGIQRAGNLAIGEADVQTDLGLDASQKAKIKDLQEKQQAAMRTLFEKMQNQEIDRSEMRPLVEKNMKILGEEYLKLLTAEQKTKFEAMKGKPFTFEEEEDGPGGL